MDSGNMPAALEKRRAMEARIAIEVEPEPAAPSAVHAEPLRLAAGIGLEEALCEVGRTCLAHLLSNEPAALAGDAEGVHQMRVALRRLRLAIAVLKGAMPPADRRCLAEALGRLDDTLAPVRNFDVLLAELLPPVRSAFAGDPDLDHLAAALAWARRTAHDRLAEELRSARHDAVIQGLLRRFEAGCRRADTTPAPAGRTIGTLLPAILDRRFRAVRKRSKGFRRQTPKARHRLRIAVKKLRYAIELFGGSLAGEDARAFLKELRRLQDGLGTVSDVRVARSLLRQLSAGAEPGGRLARAGSLLRDWHKRALAGREHEFRLGLRRLRRSARFWHEPAGGRRS
jgi:triphosphatase